MKITVKHMTLNDCYKAGRTITPKGIMVHSTAAPGVMAAVVAAAMVLALAASTRTGSTRPRTRTGALRRAPS